VEVGGVGVGVPPDPQLPPSQTRGPPVRPLLLGA
jgi:hypothetical protein